MREKNNSSFPYDNPYRFDKIDDYIYDRYNTIRSRKRRIEKEMKERKDKRK